MSWRLPETAQDRTHNPRTDIKIPKLAGNHTRAAWLEGRDSTDHATATDTKMKLQTIFNQYQLKLHSPSQKCERWYSSLEFKIWCGGGGDLHGMYVKYSARRQVRHSTCTTRVVHISVYYTKERSEVVCQVLSSLSQWPYGNNFQCTVHRPTDTRKLQIQLLSSPIPQIAPKLSQP